jgi:hypothetical protein
MLAVNLIQRDLGFRPYFYPVAVVKKDLSAGFIAAADLIVVDDRGPLCGDLPLFILRFQNLWIAGNRSDLSGFKGKGEGDGEHYSEEEPFHIRPPWVPAVCLDNNKEAKC